MRRSRGAGCLAVALVVVLVAGAAAWLLRDEILRRWFGGGVEYVEASPEAAESAEAKLARLREEGDTVRLTEVELASVLRYRVADQYPDLLQNPSVAMRGDTLRVGARFPTERLPQLNELEPVRAFMPDTTRIEVAGRLLASSPGRVTLEIGEVTVARLPIPARYYPDILERIGRQDEPGLPPNALAVPLPAGVGSARVDNGTLLLTP